MSSILETLKQKRLLAQCPVCASEFRLIDAQLFDALKRLPPTALEHLEQKRAELREERADFSKRKKKAESRPRIAAEAINIGKVVERIAPSLPGFPVKGGDCRSLFEPIDYLVFNGLSQKGRIESLFFVDVKSGNAHLSYSQAQIREVVEKGRLSLVVTHEKREKGR